MKNNYVNAQRVAQGLQSLKTQLVIVFMVQGRKEKGPCLYVNVHMKNN